MRRRSSPLRTAALALTFLIVVAALRIVLPAPEDPVGERRVDEPPPAWMDDGPRPGSPRGAPASPPVRMDARACFEAGYLCEGMMAAAEPRILRWNRERRQIVVHVGRPQGLDGALARELQRAAAAGIREWQGNPFPLRVDIGTDTASADVRVRWTRTLGGRQLGRVSSRWVESGDGWRVEIAQFLLATHSPGSGRVRDAEQVELTAAHEMGHVLGLPHSDDTRDVMYPSNTSVRLTSRDFRTLGALYDLPVGTLIEVVSDDDGGPR